MTKIKTSTRVRRSSGLTPLMHTHTAAKLRAKYRQTWGQPWPHDDRYLQQLWEEAGENSDRRQALRHELAQTAMRECDDTIPASYGAPNQETAPCPAK